MKPVRGKRVALYARVSTQDKGQTPENQLRELRVWCRRSGHRIVHEYIDHESGRKGERGRAAFAQLLADAGKRRFDLVAFWAIDRLTREGMASTIMYLRRLDNYGVAFHSYSEPFLSTDNELTRDILLAVFASLAKAESVKISERTRAGLARVRAEGKRLGRPRLSDSQQVMIRALTRQGASLAVIAQKAKVARTSVWNYRRATG